MPSSKDRTCFQPAHKARHILPNTAFFAQTIRHAYRGLRAIKDDNTNIEKTYAELLSDCLALRSVLLSSLSASVLEAIDRGEEVFVGVLAPGGYEYAVAVLAVYALGAAVVPMTVALPVEEAAYFVSKSQQVAIITSDGASKLAHSISDFVNARDKTDIKVFEVLPNLPQTHLPPQKLFISSDRHLDENGAGLVIFTSGTSGPPKGAVLRRGFISEETRAVIEWFGITSQDVLLHLLPVHHATGAMINFFPFLMAGACIEFRSGSFDPQWTWDRWCQGGLTFFSGVPTIYMRMMRLYDHKLAKLPTRERDAYRAGAANLRAMICGTSALPRPLQEFWTRLRGGRMILTRYGSTEVGAIFKVSPDPRAMADTPDGSVGELSPGVEVLLSEGEEGEVLVKSPYMLSKYLFDDDATARAFDAQGYFKTGDIARRDKGRYYTIIGRASQDIIKSGGYKISALDIEREGLSLPYISEIMVVGVDDEEYGQRVGAVISLREDQDLYAASAQQGKQTLSIHQFRLDLRHRLAGYKLPTLMRITEGELPKTASGKVLKRVLGPQLLPSPGWQNVKEVQAWHRGEDSPKSKL